MNKVIAAGLGLMLSGGIASAEVTYTKDIAPLFHKKCAECHRPGQVAPMSLLTYGETRPWAKSILNKVVNRDMPPWFAKGEMHHFENDPRLTQDEIDLVVEWVDANAPQGNPADFPTIPVFKDGWQHGEPDLVLELDTQSIDADSTDSIFEIPVSFEIDSNQHVTAVEIIPEPADIVHHVILYVSDDRKGRMANVLNWLGAWAPGQTPMLFPEGSGRLLKKDARMQANLHLTPGEVGGTSKIKIGLHFAPEGSDPVESINHWTINNSFVIPPGDDNYFASAEWTAPYDATVFGLTPHMHYRGKDMQFTAIYPDGREEVLLDSIWSNDWQLTYRPVEPYKVPKGTKVRVTGHFDNSKNNELNPDPEKEIRWGNAVTAEMFIGYIDYMPTLEESSD